ncbi:MAG: LysR substrate-binding domain-containing protein [Chloroflexota bacterium]
MLGVWRLQLLREVGRRGTIRAAAAALSITPSAVSQQLKILEAEAGVPLLEPHGRMVRLTDAGEMLVRHADTITAAIDAAESELAATRDEITGTLRIAAFPTAARAILPGVIAELGSAHPRLRLTLRDLETAESLEALRLDEVDLAVIDVYDEATQVVEPGIELAELMAEPLWIALPAGHPAGPGPVSLASLADDPWIMDTEASNIGGAVVRACARIGFAPNVRSNCRDYSVIIALVEAGLGVAVLPGLALRDRGIRARVAPLEPAMTRRVLIAVKSGRRGHPAVAALLAALIRRGDGLPPEAA